VVTATERLTYGELHARADALATRLRDAGAGPGRVVAVCLPRGAGLVVAPLGILRAGAAFLPIDPENPAERIAQLCADARAVSMVGDEQSAPALPSGVRLIGVYGPAADATGADQGPVPATRPAYVIFTSGSTGRPKGVLVEHGALANLAAWHRDMFGLTPRDRVTMVASPGFDASVGEIWPTLAAGAALYVPDAETRLSAPRLAAWLAGNEITVSDLPTALAEAVLEEPWPPDIALRHLITGGDRLRVRPPADLPFRFVNTYGPTESTVMVTAGPVRPEHDRHGTPGIGCPVPGATVRVLDDELRAVPDGVPGQIFLAGNTLARGYLGPAGLTADRFVPDPFRPGGRLYRTGDLARRRPDGALEFLGRVDDQLSVRGFRIEPAEIVAALRTHPAVADAYVTTRSPDGTGDPLLVAYLAGYAAGGDRPGPAALRRHLAATLPAYLVPHRFAWLPALPLNRNGKIDERALPDPPHLAPVPAAAAPATEVERLVAGLWRDTLGLAEVGVHDNFFDLGGHSLQLGRVHHRLTEELRRDVPLLDLFRYPTVRSLAEHLTGGPAEAGADDPAGGSREAARARLSRRRSSITGTAR
jgi:amino acid adenylation domain-containing protein